MKIGSKITVWTKPNKRGKKLTGTVVKNVCRVADVETVHVHIDGDPDDAIRVVSVPVN